MLREVRVDMSYFVQWVKNIAVFYIIASLVMHLIPGKNYQKYIKLFLGIITIILLLKPLGEILKLEDNYRNYLNNNLNFQMQESLKSELQIVDELQKEAVIGDYKEKIRENIKNYVESIEIKYIDADVEIELNEQKSNFGGITGISVYVDDNGITDSSVNPSEELISIEIKKYLANFYNLDKRNINVYIS